MKTALLAFCLAATPVDSIDPVDPCDTDGDTHQGPQCGGDDCDDHNDDKWEDCLPIGDCQSPDCRDPRDPPPPPVQVP